MHSYWHCVLCSWMSKHIFCAAVFYHFRPCNLRNLSLTGAWTPKHTWRPHTQSGQGRTIAPPLTVGPTVGINIPVECKCSCSQLYPHQVKEENLKLKSENGVLGQYIENLMQVRTQWAKYCIQIFKISVCGSKNCTVEDCGAGEPVARDFFWSIICQTCAFHRLAMYSRQSAPSQGGKNTKTLMTSQKQYLCP